MLEPGPLALSCFASQTPPGEQVLPSLQAQAQGQQKQAHLGNPRAKTNFLSLEIVYLGCFVREIENKHIYIIFQG